MINFYWPFISRPSQDDMNLLNQELVSIQSVMDQALLEKGKEMEELQDKYQKLEQSRNE